VSRRLPRLAFSSSAAALALVVVLPTAALACEKGGDESGARSGHSRDDRKGGQDSAKDHQKAEGKDSNSKDSNSKDSNSKDSEGNNSEGKDSNSKDSQGNSSGESGGSSTSAGHNPPGNNGTIKVDYPAPADSGNANRPHPGCGFQLRMFDFDANQYGTITFVGQAPTKLGTLLTQQHVLLSDDAAGGGQDADAVYSYTAQQLGLTDKPQAKQGWHVKVSVDAENAPGGAKHKVFWLSCPEAAPAAAGSSGGTGTTATTPAAQGTTPQGSTSQGAAAQGTATQGTAPQGAVAQGTTLGSAQGATTPAAGTAVTQTQPAAATTAMGGTTAGAVSAGTAAGAATAPQAAGAAAAPATQTRGSALPFTGLALGSLVALALAALAAGALAIRAGRRRTTEV
jgi:hypothetical protein